MSTTHGPGAWYIGSAYKMVTKYSDHEKHMAFAVVGKSLTPSEPQFLICLQNETSNSIYWIGLLGKFGAFMCKMPNAMYDAPHVGPMEDQVLFLSTFNILAAILGRA